MADFGSPVAQGVDVNPTRAVQTLSGLLGLKQQQQALETGQSIQQSAKAKASVDTQGATENQNVVQALQDPVGNGFIDKDGNPTADGLAKFVKIAPNSGAERYGKFVDAARSKVDFNTSLNNLSAQEQQEIGSNLSGAAAGAKSFGDLQSSANFLKEAKKGTPLEGDYNRLIDASMHIISQGGDPMADPAKVPFAKQQQAALAAGQRVLGAAGVVGPGGIANPQATSNAAGQNLNRSATTGALSAPQLGPGATNPASPQVAGQTSRAIGTAGSDVERGNQVSALIQPSKNGVAITSEIDNLADQVHSGKFVAAISKAAAAVGMSDATYARQVLEKDLGRLKTVASEGAGSDARASTILSGFPTAESDAQTIHNAMDYARGTFKQNLARGDLLNKVKTKDTSLQGFQHADDTLTSSSDPLMHEFGSLQKPEERIAFYKRHFSSPAEAQDFRNKVAGMGHVLGN